MHQERGAKASNVKLPVVLLKDVEGLGTSGDIARVARGYARNYLMPKKLAAGVPRATSTRLQFPADYDLTSSHPTEGTSSNAKARDSEEKEKEDFIKLQRQARSVVKKLTESALTIKKRVAGDKGILESPVGAEDLSQAIAKQLTISIDPKMIHLEGETLTSIGEYSIPLRLLAGPDGKVAHLDVNIVST